MKEKDEIKYYDWDEVYKNYWNINITDNPDEYPIPDYSIFPVAIKHNWDYKNIVSLPFLNEDECNLILSKWNNKVADKWNEDSRLNSHRKCRINWVHYYQPTWEWLFEKIGDVAFDVNKNVFKFDLSNPLTQAPIQFTEYKKDGYYKKHLDWRGASTHDIRKLSYVINLSNPKDYSGGHFEVKSEKVEKNRGMIHFFPSFLNHQATKVLTGTRYSLVGWITGPTFK